MRIGSRIPGAEFGGGGGRSSSSANPGLVSDGVVRDARVVLEYEYEYESGDRADSLLHIAADAHDRGRADHFRKLLFGVRRFPARIRLRRTAPHWGSGAGGGRIFLHFDLYICWEFCDSLRLTLSIGGIGHG
jgi:hypothetical protein